MDLLDRDSWGTHRLLEVSAGLPDTHLDQPFDIGHRTLRETFGHMIVTVSFWTAFLAGHQPAAGEYSTDAQPDDRSPAALIAHHERAYTAFVTLARRLGEISVDHSAVRTSIGGTILTVIEHNSEHRTKILHILQRLGVAELPEIDLGVGLSAAYPLGGRTGAGSVIPVS